MSAQCFALLLITVAAFAWQSLLTQTHLHGDPDTLISAGFNVSSGAAVASKTGKFPPERPINCPLCHAMAMSGHFLTPADIVMLVPQPPVFALAVTRRPPLIDQRHWHGWRSREPPAALV